MIIEKECQELIKNFKEESKSYLIFKLNELDNEQTTLYCTKKGKSAEAFEDFKNFFNEKECSYAVLHYILNGELFYVFYFYCPSSASNNQKMSYGNNKNEVKKLFKFLKNFVYFEVHDSKEIKELGANIMDNIETYSPRYNEGCHITPNLVTSCHSYKF